MILISKHKVETSENFQELTFGVREQDMGLILEILRSRMYSNPIGSICREIACNSLDANREAGKKDVPVEIIIQDSPWLGGDLAIFFKDEGPGISPERMADVFVNYGASTKRTTNELTGSFGLGAKTPFSYADSFIIVTTVDGTEYVYAAAIEEGRRGKLYLLDKKEIQQPNGTTIVVPIKSQSDRRTFEEECYKATVLWTVQPKYVNFQMEAPTFTKYFEAEGCRYLKHDLSLNAEYNLLIDGVIYPIDSAVIDFANKGLYDGSFFMDFKIGELTISANREAVQYDKETITKIKKKFAISLKHCRKYLDSYISSAPTYMEACVRFGRMRYRTENSSKPNSEYWVWRLVSSQSQNDLEFKFGDKKVDDSLSQFEGIQFTVIHKEKVYSGGRYKKTSNKNHFDSDFFDFPTYLMDEESSVRKNRTIFAKHTCYISINLDDNLKDFGSKVFRQKKHLAKMMRTALNSIKNLKDLGLHYSLYSTVEDTFVKREAGSSGDEEDDGIREVKACYVNSSWESVERTKITRNLDRSLNIENEKVKKAYDNKTLCYTVVESIRDIDRTKIRSIKTVQEITKYFVIIVNMKGMRSLQGKVTKMEEVLAQFKENMMLLVDAKYIGRTLQRRHYYDSDLSKIIQKATFEESVDKRVREILEFIKKGEGFSDSEEMRKLLGLPDSYCHSEKAKEDRKFLIMLLRKYPLLSHLLDETPKDVLDEYIKSCDKLLN